MGGSGKRSLRSLPMVFTRIPRAIGKPRLPLPPVAIVRPRRFIRQREDFAMLT
jgi:hypothetical protein